MFTIEYVNNFLDDQHAKVETSINLEDEVFRKFKVAIGWIEFLLFVLMKFLELCDCVFP